MVAAVSCSPVPYMSGGVKMGFWWRASEALHGSVHGLVLGMVHGWCMCAWLCDVVMWSGVVGVGKITLHQSSTQSCKICATKQKAK